MYHENIEIVRYNRPLVVVVIDFTQHTKHYQGDSQNEINDKNTEDTVFRSREISHTDCVQYCIYENYQKPGNLCLSQDLPHHDQLNPNIIPYFSGRLVWVTETWFMHLLLMIINRR